jgi:hypothetical protein
MTMFSKATIAVATILTVSSMSAARAEDPESNPPQRFNGYGYAQQYRAQQVSRRPVLPYSNIERGWFNYQR